MVIEYYLIHSANNQGLFQQNFSISLILEIQQTEIIMPLQKVQTRTIFSNLELGNFSRVYLILHEIIMRSILCGSQFLTSSRNPLAGEITAYTGFSSASIKQNNKKRGCKDYIWYQCKLEKGNRSHLSQKSYLDKNNLHQGYQFLCIILMALNAWFPKSEGYQTSLSIVKLFC